MEALILTVLLTSVPLIFAATGELVAERSGVLNLGVEGMMLMGAVSAFAATSILGNPYMGILAGAVAGAMMRAVYQSTCKPCLARSTAGASSVSQGIRP